MAQQTAVEFYADKQLELHQKLKDNQISMIDFVVQSRDLLIESKQMFKQQIVKAHREQSYLQDDGSWLELTGEQYYNETYTTRLQNETN